MSLTEDVDAAFYNPLEVLQGGSWNSTFQTLAEWWKALHGSYPRLPESHTAFPSDGERIAADNLSATLPKNEATWVQFLSQIGMGSLPPTLASIRIGEARYRDRRFGPETFGCFYTLSFYETADAALALQVTTALAELGVTVTAGQKVLWTRTGSVGDINFDSIWNAQPIDL